MNTYSRLNSAADRSRCLDAIIRFDKLAVEMLQCVRKLAETAGHDDVRLLATIAKAMSDVVNQVNESYTHLSPPDEEAR